MKAYSAFSIVFAAIVWQALAQPSEPEPEPVYEGRTLTSWVQDYQSAHGRLEEFNMQKQVEAVRHIGTNAIPIFLRMIRTTPYTHKSGLAAEGFAILGADAQSAVPALIEMANQSATSRSCAIYALGCIGPSAKQAVPTLLQWAANSDAGASLGARGALLKIDPEAAAKAGITNSTP